MAEARQCAFTLTAIVQRVFADGFRQPIAGGSGYRRHYEGGAYSLAIPFHPLSPFWRRIVFLVDARSDCSPDDGIWAECVEQVVVNLDFFCRVRIRPVRGWIGRTCGQSGSARTATTRGVVRKGRRLGFCRDRQRRES